MKKFTILFVATALFVLTSCKDEKKDTNPLNDPADTEQTTSENELMDREDPAAEAKMVVVNLDSKSDSKAKGEATFTEKDGVVSMKAKFTGLKPGGTHAIHLHEVGDCNSADGMSTKGHWNPTDDPHGKWDASDGYHKGDIGNLKADEDGNASLTFETDQWCIGCADDEKNIIGKAVIVHEDADDFKSQPTGDAGGRIACGEINQ